MGPERHALPHGADDRRMRVALHHRAEAVVEVEVLVAVHVPDARALAASEVDGPGVTRVERGRDAAGQRRARSPEHGSGRGRALGEQARLALAQLAEALPIHGSRSAGNSGSGAFPAIVSAMSRPHMKPGTLPTPE